MQATLVEVQQVVPQSQTVTVHAIGTVVPARTIQLAAQVSGRIISVSRNFTPGGHFHVNEAMLQIEPRDYELAVQQQDSVLAQAECDLKVEMGQQAVAKRESELLGREIQEEDMELLLRKPQLAMAEAKVKAAQAALEQAKLDLIRTQVVAPFNAMVQSCQVDLGSQVSVGTALATLVDTDTYWVQVSVPVDQLQWIDVPRADDEKGSPVRIYNESAWEAGVFRTGEVRRLMPNLEPEGRMAMLLVVVEDPLDLTAPAGKRHPLILDSYARVEIQGRDLSDVVRIPRTALRDGNCVWVMQPDGTLDIRNVKIAWSGNTDVCICEGLSAGDALIVSDLAVPVAGMALRAAEAAEGNAADHLAESPHPSAEPEDAQ